MMRRSPPPAWIIDSLFVLAAAALVANTLGIAYLNSSN